MQPSHTRRRSNLWPWLALSAVLLMALSASLLSAATDKSAHLPVESQIGISATTLVLYDGSRNTGTPDRQSMLYLTRPNPPAASQSFADGTTTLTTIQRTSDIAGYSNNPFLMPAFDRTTGFTMHFTVQLVTENHPRSDKNGDGIGDRAGLSVTLLGSDHKGIELGFWPDQVWAQQDGSAQPPPNTNTLFTHGESAPFNPTAGMTSYALGIQGDDYVLASGDKTILSGRVRDYSAGGQPYTTGNFLFLGDNSGTANGQIKLSAVSLSINAAESATATATPTATPSPPIVTSTPTLMPTDAALPSPTPESGSPRVLLPVVTR